MFSFWWEHLGFILLITFLFILIFNHCTLKLVYFNPYYFWPVPWRLIRKIQKFYSLHKLSDKKYDTPFWKGLDPIDIVHINV